MSLHRLFRLPRPPFLLPRSIIRSLSRPFDRFYQELGVSEGASPSELKQAYHRRALECHPDLHSNDGKEFMRVTEAYNVLINGGSRINRVQTSAASSSETRIFQGPQTFIWVSIMLGVVLFAYPLNMYFDNRGRALQNEPTRFVEPTRDAVKRERIAAILLEKQRKAKEQK